MTGNKETDNKTNLDRTDHKFKFRIDWKNKDREKKSNLEWTEKGRRKVDNKLILVSKKRFNKKSRQKDK